MIRYATPDDVDDIISFIDSSGMVFHSKTTIRRMVCGGDSGRKPYIIGLAIEDDVIVGISIVSSKSRTLSLLYVNPKYRGKSLGKKLLDLTNPKQLLIKRDAIGYFFKVFENQNTKPLNPRAY